MSKEIVSRIAYLIGVKTEHFVYFDDSVIDLCENSNDCSLIRKLNMLRTKLMTNYFDIQQELKNKYGKISEVECLRELYDSLLNKHGMDIELYSTDVNIYMETVNKEIENKIDLIYPIFPSTLHHEIWKYIRSLFVIPLMDLMDERKKYITNKLIYPFSCYIHWNPKKSGNILETDQKFLSILFSNNGDTYKMTTDDAVNDIEIFINKCKRVIMAVDCENIAQSDFYTALKQFGTRVTEKIEKILLFNDPNLESGWKYYNNIPIDYEIIDCLRICDNKSTLDVKMSTYLTAAHYRDGIDGIILVSSDSDYWGLIDTLRSTAKIFVLCQKDKVSKMNLSALSKECIPYCMLDDFANSEIKESILIDTYKACLDNIEFSADYFVQKIEEKIKYLTDDDKNLIKKLICNSRISFDKNGKAIIVL